MAPKRAFLDFDRTLVLRIQEAIPTVNVTPYQPEVRSALGMPALMRRAEENESVRKFEVQDNNHSILKTYWQY